MLSSMTGFGDAEGQVLGAVYAVEIRTVNNRYFKAGMKLPEEMLWLEQDIERLLRENLVRGSINLLLRAKNVGQGGMAAVDKAVLRRYLEELKAVTDSVGGGFSVDIGSLFALPGVTGGGQLDEQARAAVREAVLTITRQTIDKLKQMRLAEGAALEQVLCEECAAIREQVSNIGTRCRAVVQEYQAKLQKRVDELLAEAKFQLDRETLAREMAVFADRSDISEEMARLSSHIEQFEQTCRAGDKSGQAGRRLDFICQEMLREANTISGKAGDSRITHWVVDIKCRIERLKEQVQNVE